MQLTVSKFQGTNDQSQIIDFFSFVINHFTIENCCFHVDRSRVF